MTEAEVSRLFANTTGMLRPVFRLLALCGLRIGELLALWPDDLHAGALRVDESELRGERSSTKNSACAPCPCRPRCVPNWRLGHRVVSNRAGLAIPQRCGQDVYPQYDDPLRSRCGAVCRRDTRPHLPHVPHHVRHALWRSGRRSGDPGPLDTRLYREQVQAAYPDRAAADVNEMEKRLSNIVRMKWRA